MNRAWVIVQRRPAELFFPTISLFKDQCILDFVENGKYTDWDSISDMFACIEIEIVPISLHWQRRLSESVFETSEEDAE